MQYPGSVADPEPLQNLRWRALKLSNYLFVTTFKLLRTLPQTICRGSGSATGEPMLTLLLYKNTNIVLNLFVPRHTTLPWLLIITVIIG